MRLPTSNHVSSADVRHAIPGRNRFRTGVLTGLFGGVLGALAAMRLGLIAPTAADSQTGNGQTKDLQTSIAALRSDLAQLESTLHGNELTAAGPSTSVRTQPVTDSHSPEVRADTAIQANASARPAEDMAKYDQIRTNLQQMPFSRNYTLQDLTRDMSTLPVDRQREIISELTKMMNNGQLRPEIVYRMK